MTLHEQALTAAIQKHLPALKKMAGLVIHPARNVFSRMVEDFEAALKSQTLPKPKATEVRLVRAMNPQEGDLITYRLEDQSERKLEVKSVGDGMVCYAVTIDGETYDNQLSLEDWTTVARSHFEFNDTSVFTPRESRN